MSNRDVRTQVVIALIAAMAAAIVIYATSSGVGTDVDSAAYLMAARSFIAGKGVVLQTAGDARPHPLTLFPPVLPMILGAIGFFGVDPLSVARWLNAVLFGSDIFLLGWITKQCTRSDIAAIFCAAVVATTADVVAIHSMLISEPLFLFFVLLGLMLMVRYIERPTLSSLAGFSVAFAAACGTRYIGVILIPVGAAVAALVPSQSRLKKMHLSIYLGLFIFPAIFLVVRNLTLAHTLTNHPFGFHPPDLSRFRFSYLSLSTWIFPEAVPQLLRVTLLAAAIAIVLMPIWLSSVTKPVSPKSRFDLVLIGLLGIYLAGFLAAQIFVDSHIWIAGRHLLFPYVIGTLLVISQGAALVGKLGPKARFVSLALCASFLVLGAARTSRSALRTHEEGLGLSSKRWKTSELVGQVRRLGSRVPLISNSGAAIYLLTGTLTYPLSSAVKSSQLNTRLDAGAVVVYFTAFQPLQLALSEEKAFEADFHLRRMASTPEGYLLARCANDCSVSKQILSSKNAQF